MAFVPKFPAALTGDKVGGWISIPPGRPALTADFICTRTEQITEQFKTKLSSTGSPKEETEGGETTTGSV